LLAYGHPTLMLVALSLVFFALRRGLALRRSRLRGAGGRGALVRRHVALARPALILLFIGFVAGPLSAVWLRDWLPLRTLHGWLGVGAAIAFAFTGWLGARLHDGRSRAVELHARLALVAVLAAALAAIAGFVLLP
jgi:hypothetical protein